MALLTLTFACVSRHSIIWFTERPSTEPPLIRYRASGCLASQWQHGCANDMYNVASAFRLPAAVPSAARISPSHHPAMPGDYDEASYSTDSEI